MWSTRSHTIIPITVGDGNEVWERLLYTCSGDTQLVMVSWMTWEPQEHSLHGCALGSTCLSRYQTAGCPGVDQTEAYIPHAVEVMFRRIITHQHDGM